MSDKPETKVYGIPGDLPRLEARGHIRLSGWTARALARRLDHLDDCIAAGVVPDAKGRREPSKDGRKRWRAVLVPDELAPHMADLAEEVKACRALLDAGDIAVAGARMDRSEALLTDMARRATPASERTRKAAAKGGDARAGAMRGRRAKEAREVAAAVAEVETRTLNRTAAVEHVARRRAISVRTVWNMLKRVKNH